MTKSNLRKKIRQTRNALSYSQQQRAAQKLLRLFSKHPKFRSAKNIAFYLANDGEISPEHLASFAHQKNKAIYLPAITAFNSMDFRRYEGANALVQNRYGILEPSEKSPSISPLLLDIVFVPLVAFDKRGNRLGMGGGYYDRTFAFKQKYPKRGPTLIALAHQCQEVESLDCDSWDIRVDYIVTDKRVRKI